MFSFRSFFRSLSRDCQCLAYCQSVRPPAGSAREMPMAETQRGSRTFIGAYYGKREPSPGPDRLACTTGRSCRVIVATPPLSAARTAAALPRWSSLIVYVFCTKKRHLLGDSAASRKHRPEVENRRPSHCRTCLYLILARCSQAVRRPGFALRVACGTGAPFAECVISGTPKKQPGNGFPGT